MYLGKLVELATRDMLFENRMHPYAISLLSAVPIPDPVKERQRKRIILEGDVPSPSNPPSGCRFHTRCPIVQDRCKIEDPPLKKKNRDTGWPVTLRKKPRNKCFKPLCGTFIAK